MDFLFRTLNAIFLIEFFKICIEFGNMLSMLFSFTNFIVFFKLKQINKLIIQYSLFMQHENINIVFFYIYIFGQCHKFIFIL